LGAAPLLPLILGYTAYVYWTFRAKVGDDAYH
jgi:cytochrome bd-type quinol oxidase subunit 2